MPKYVYTVQDAQGTASTGVLEAGDEDQAILTLQNKGYFILSIQLEAEKSMGGFKKAGAGGKVNGQTLAFFSEQLATLLAGGVPLVRALSLLGEHNSDRNLSAVLGEVSKEVSAGGALYKALEKHPKTFDTIWVSLVQAGEMGGQLPLALRQIADYTQKQEGLKGKIITAIAYPSVLLVMSLGVLAYFVVYIVPVFAGIFRDFNLKLPAVTAVVVAMSDMVVNNLAMLLLALIGIVVGFKFWISTEAGLMSWNRTTMSMPVFGKFVSNVIYERLLTTMGTLIQSGVSILNTITVLEGSFNKNLIVQKALRDVKNEVASGKSISVAFKNTGIFPSLVTEMMWMGEESGKLPDIIKTLSGFYSEQINQFIARFSSMIDPILIVGIGGIIAVIVMSVFMPIFQLSQISGK
ncbi:MAG: type II secretion system F family protein [Elusimicrobiaceae bacterium]|nr:type II secretion system F family protein [Elusimicrobiaceae bacterium]